MARKITKRKTVPSRLRLEALEDRVVPTITWVNLTNQPAETVPSGVPGVGTMMLLTNGDVMVQGGGVSSGGLEYAANQWYQLIPDSSGSYVNGTFATAGQMTNGRLYYGSNVLPNGDIFAEGGEYSRLSTDSNLGEVYSPTANAWTPSAAFPQSQFGDDSTVLLPNGQVLAGYLGGPETYLYTPANSTTSDSWTATGTKLYDDQSDEESFPLLPDGSVLTYDIWSSTASDQFQGQRYISSGVAFPWGGTSTGQWIDASHLSATNPPSLLSDSLNEMGPGVLLQNGSVFVMGSNGNTAYYDPSGYTHNTDGSYSLGTWSAGPPLPSVTIDGSSVQLSAEDDPAAELPNGKILLALSAPGYDPPTYIYEFDPAAGADGTFTRLDNASGFPSDLATALGSVNAYQTRMLDLPNGEVLFSMDNSTQVWDFSDSSGSPASSPTISSLSANGDGTFTLSGTRLTGLSEGAYYGDDAEMSTNYPIVTLTSTTNGSVWHATTSDWTPGVATGSATVTAQVALPLNLPADTYSVTVSASGVTSSPYSFTWDGPIYVDTHFNSGTPITDADPVAPGDQPATFGVNAFSSVNAGIAAAASAHTWVIVNGANGDTGSGVFDEAVADNDGVLLVLQQGLVTFDSLSANNSDASVFLNGVDLTTDADSSSDPFDGALVGTGGLNKVGTQTLTLEGNDSGYSGPVTITGGAITLGNANALYDSTVTVDVNLGLATGGLSAATLGALAGTGNFYLGSTNLTVGGNDADTTYSGDLSDSVITPGSITKVGLFIETGTGTWTLSGDNRNYFGGVTIDAGTITVGSANALFSSTVTIDATYGYNLDAVAGLAATTLGGLQGGGSVILGDDTFASSTDFTIGENNANTTFSGMFNGGGLLNKDGTGTLTLTGDNNQSGDVVVTNGILSVPDDAALGVGGLVTVYALGTLEFTGST